MTDIPLQYRRVLERIAAAAARSGRDARAVRLIAVTKTIAAARIREGAGCGVLEIGESRLQEALSKRDELRGLPFTWHFIGRLQTNKAKKIAETFDWVHSVDRIEAAEKLDAAAGAKRLPVLIEVNLGGETAKGGALESALAPLVTACRSSAHLDLRGLMTVPPYFEDPEQTRPFFRCLRERALDFGLAELSMGMSHDFEVAIEEGATMVRIGTAIFGARS